jgi:TetR/AcrR family transcriptional regulator
MASKPQQKLPSRERRKLIIEKAIELFAEKGFRGVTTRALAAAVGVTEPVLYEHFSSKRVLYEEILLGQIQERKDLLVESLEPFREARDDEGFFLTFCISKMKRLDENHTFLRFLLQVFLEGGELAEVYYREQSLATHELIDSYVRLRIEEGAFQPIDPKVASRSLVSFLIYHGILQQLVHDTYIEEPSEDIIREFVTLYLRGLRAKES